MVHPYLVFIIQSFDSHRPTLMGKEKEGVGGKLLGQGYFRTIFRKLMFLLDKDRG